MTALNQIKELDAEIIRSANLKALLERNLSDAASEKTKEILRAQTTELERRIRRAQAEIQAIENAHFAEIQIERRNRIYPPIPEPRKIYIAFADGLEAACETAVAGRS